MIFIGKRLFNTCLQNSHAILSAPTEVVALENTLNGTIIPQEEVVAISDWVHSNGVKMHLDGARLWHVAIETGTPLKELCDPFDSVSLCFSKGLGKPTQFYIPKHEIDTHQVHRSGHAL